MRKPFAWLKILLLKRGIQNTQAPYLARRRRIVALYVGFGLAVGSLQGKSACGLLNTCVSFGIGEKYVCMCVE